MDHQVVTVHLHSNENDLNFEKKTKKIIKLRKRKTTLIDSCTATSSFIFKLKHHLKKKKKSLYLSRNAARWEKFIFTCFTCRPRRRNKNKILFLTKAVLTCGPIRVD